MPDLAPLSPVLFDDMLSRAVRNRIGTAADEGAEANLLAALRAAPGLAEQARDRVAFYQDGEQTLGSRYAKTAVAVLSDLLKTLSEAPCPTA